MNTKTVTKALKEALVFNEELLDFIDQCLKDIFKGEYDFAKSEFEQSIDCLEYNGCLQSLQLIKDNVKNHQDNVVKWSKQKAIEAEKQAE